MFTHSKRVYELVMFGASRYNFFVYQMLFSHILMTSKHLLQ